MPPGRPLHPGLQRRSPVGEGTFNRPYPVPGPTLARVGRASQFHRISNVDAPQSGYFKAIGGIFCPFLTTLPATTVSSDMVSWPPHTYDNRSRAEMQQLVRLLGLRGTFGPWTVDKHGNLRKRRRSDLEGFRTAPTREAHRVNSSDFSFTSRLGAAIRHALPELLQPYSAPAPRGRFTGTLRRLVALDVARPCGQRRLLATHLPALAGFSFNSEIALPAGLQHGCTVSRVNSNRLLLTLPTLPAPAQRGLPARATHYGYRVGLALLDELTGTIRAVALPALPSPCPLTGPFAALPIPLYCESNGRAAGPEAAILVVGLCYYETCAGQLVPLPTANAPLAVAFAGAVAPPPAGPQPESPVRRDVKCPLTRRKKRPASATLPAFLTRANRCQSAKYPQTQAPVLPLLRPRHQQPRDSRPARSSPAHPHPACHLTPTRSRGAPAPAGFSAQISAPFYPAQSAVRRTESSRALCVRALPNGVPLG